MRAAFISKKRHKSQFQIKLKYRPEGNIKAAAFMLELVLSFCHLFNSPVIVSSISACANIDHYLHPSLTNCWTPPISYTKFPLSVEQGFFRFYVAYGKPCYL